MWSLLQPTRRPGKKSTVFIHTWRASRARCLLKPRWTLSPPTMSSLWRFLTGNQERWERPCVLAAATPSCLIWELIVACKTRATGTPTTVEIFRNPLSTACPNCCALKALPNVSGFKQPPTLPSQGAMPQGSPLLLRLCLLPGQWKRMTSQRCWRLAHRELAGLCARTYLRQSSPGAPGRMPWGEHTATFRKSAKICCTLQVTTPPCR